MPIELNADEMEFIGRMAEQVRTQDNAITADPIFYVQRSRRIYGVDSTYTDNTVWIEDCEEVTEEHSKKLDEWEDTGKWDDPEGEYCNPKKCTRTGYFDIWENVQPFFTRAGAEHYIKINGHNIFGPHPPRIYVDSAYRNAEWRAMRNLLLNGYAK